MKSELLINIGLLVFLALPVLYEVVDDAAGDLNKKKDVIWRILLMIVMAFIVRLTGYATFLTALNAATAIHFMFFDYIIAAVLISNGTLEPPRGVKYHWWTYEAKGGLVDNIAFWRNMNPWIKLAIRVVYFIISIWLFLTIR